ncbi:MAG TPA: tRNA uridine-5-carboxymethylaminomethyl(34) synthesis GTPase MnmE [Bacteroidales bacterium]|nr:tRNA uridine-5-carboxymethylaminomethyl(34) synthesis GTPase MnmE [Bacteroidales bacterium]
MIRTEETICAPATAMGGALAIIRVSGMQSLEICQKIFFPAGKNIVLPVQKGYTLLFGEIRSGDEVIDEVLISIFRSPHSYTGEDSVEISCHASPYIITRTLELLTSNGAVTAHPGEFTQRAFLNGRLDLSQAEAVADIINSTTRSAHSVAMNQMRGGFSAEIEKLRSELLYFTSLIELELDFGEEDVEFADRSDLKKIILKAKDITDRLADSFSLGNVIKNGIPVVIVGKPNSGKSTLLNALLMEEKAIVSEIPGTTRDAIEDSIVIEGTEFRFIDTAGLRETADLIETIGIKKTHEKIDQASVVMLVDEVNDSTGMILERINSIRAMINGRDKKLFILINKTDTSTEQRNGEIRKAIALEEGESMIFISAKAKSGIDDLRKHLGEVMLSDRPAEEDVIITNARHFEALSGVSASLQRVIEGLETGIPEDLIALDIRQAIHYLGEITGEITNDEVLGNIFKNFCIGK